VLTRSKGEHLRKEMMKKNNNNIDKSKKLQSVNPRKGRSLKIILKGLRA
jgi:hypothetical protein